jgi:hypothetical protein
MTINIEDGPQSKVFGSTESALRTIRHGARLVVYGNDGLMLQNALDGVISELKKG